jgi:parallel beta-helix repeat protein
MADQDQQPIGNIRAEYNVATTGMNMDNTVNQVPKGMLTYALNAAVENFDSSSVNYQNEPGNEFCVQFPEGYQLIGNHSIYEQNKHIFFLVNPDTGGSEIGYMENNDCIYHTYVNADCLNFDIHYPIHKAVHKITNCNTEIYWTDGYNARRYLDITDIATIYTVKPGTDVCANETIPVIDCNKLKLQPNFSIPKLAITDVISGGDLKAGTYQFAIQYCDAIGDGYTSYYSVTNPTPIADTKVVTLNFDYQVGKSIELNISGIDTTGYYKYFNLAVIKTINAVASVELVGTYFIDKSEKRITYTGQNETNIKLSINDIFEKFPFYDIAQDLTAVQDILVWDQLTSIERTNYQKIANQIILQWQTHRLPGGENYRDELNATNYRGYLRDEVYAFEIVFLLRNGKQTDGFHIPGRTLNDYDLSFPEVPNTNPDFVGEPTYVDDGTKIGYSPYWKIYNTGRKISDAPEKTTAKDYKGPWEYGDFAYWESTELYPCNEAVWGELANQPIRHHKFPDVLVSPIFESATPTITSGKYTVEMQANDAIFPIGVKLDVAQVYQLIQTSDLTQEQKNDIMAFKIVRGNRGTNKSIVAKGILRNVGKYKRQGTEYYYPNYPYNDLKVDPFLLNNSNAYTANSLFASGSSGGTVCRSFKIQAQTETIIRYLSCSSLAFETKKILAGTTEDICSLDYPSPTIENGGLALITSNTYKTYKITARSAHFNYVPPKPNCIPSSINCINNSDPCCIHLADRDRYILGSTTGSQSSATVILDSIIPPTFTSGDTNYIITEIAAYGYELCAAIPLEGFKDADNKYRLIFNSPETSFGNPFLGNVLKLENVMFGAGRAHFTEVKKNAMYKLLTAEAQNDALTSSFTVANGDITAAFTAYQAYLTIYVNGITRRNYAYSFNSIASYDYSDVVENNYGIKQRPIELSQYLLPVVQSVGDNLNINNWNRETSVFIKTDDNEVTVPVTYDQLIICNRNVTGDQTFATVDPDNSNVYTYTTIPAGQCVNLNSISAPVRTSGSGDFRVTSSGVVTKDVTKKKDALPFPSNTRSLFNLSSGSLFEEDSRFTLSERGECYDPAKELPSKVISYYASMKNIFVNQWGQMYSYDTIDTGFQRNIDSQSFNTSTESPEVTIFGGDTFISRFAFKIKLPFFIDNRVGAPDDSDIFYDEIGNVAYPTYWHSARSILGNYTQGSSTLSNIISIKAHNFDCPNKQEPATNNPGRTYYDGKFYLFAYGIPNFYCETSYNVDLRQAFNNREGEFWPHVSTGIPDDWVQESFVPIAQDNTYYYNTTFSKQNTENYFSHLPVDWTPKLCYTYFPFKTIYSDRQINYLDNKANNWLIYRPVSTFDFPQNYGKLVSLDGIQNRAILARFDNKTLLYNKLLTIDTSNPQAAYIGNDKLFAGAPPIDFAETDLGYVGSQHKFLLKIPQGQISVDAKRGQVFLLGNEGAVDLSAFGSGLNRFFTDHLAFEILRYFPDVDIDNHFNSIGLHGVYDSKYDRVIISKLDYIPLPDKGVKYDPETKEFYVEKTYYVNPVTTTTTSTTEAPRVNVKDFGATGDGETDDTQFILDAIEYAEENNIPRIYFPSGTYMVTRGFLIQDEFTVFGDGNSSLIKLFSGLPPRNDEKTETTIFVGKNAWSRYNSPSYFDTFNITIKNLAIDLQKPHDEYNINNFSMLGAIRFINAKNCLVENVKIINPPSFGIGLYTGIYGTDCKGNTIKNCKIELQPYWWLPGLGPGEVGPEYISPRQTSLIGIEIVSPEGPHTNGTQIYLNRSNPDYIQSKTFDNHIIGNNISGGSHGVSLQNTYSNKIENNTVSGPSHRGVIGVGTNDNNLIKGNTFTNIGSTGVHFAYGCNGNTIINNTVDGILGVEGDGIKTYINCNNSTITDNTVKNFYKTGIRVAHGANNNTIKNNTIIGNTQSIQYGVKIIANILYFYDNGLAFGGQLTANDNVCQDNVIRCITPTNYILLGDEVFTPPHTTGNTITPNTTGGC